MALPNRFCHPIETIEMVQEKPREGIAMGQANSFSAAIGIPVPTGEVGKYEDDTGDAPKVEAQRTDGKA